MLLARSVFYVCSSPSPARVLSYLLSPPPLLVPRLHVQGHLIQLHSLEGGATGLGDAVGRVPKRLRSKLARNDGLTPSLLRAGEQ